MNIESKIAELDAQIADRTKTKDVLGSDSDAKERIYKAALHEWAIVYNEIEELKAKRKILAELQKECECVIPGPVDEDIGRTVPLPPEVKGIGGVMYPNIRADKHLIRTPIFKGDQEREFIEPK